jgi:integrase
MSKFKSGFSELAEKFVLYRKASGSWNEPCYGLNIRLFDQYCADNFGAGSTLSQEMVDAWCAKRTTESNRSHDTRTRIVRTFIDYLRQRGLTDVLPVATFKPEPTTYIPHAFEDDELRRFFDACDSITPYLGRHASVVRKLTIPVIFRLLYSTGMRTTEARLLKRDNVDLAQGVIDIQKSKGYDQHYVVTHDTMTSLMARYDRAISGLQPSREYFFQSIKGSCYCREWLRDNFCALWKEANGPLASPVPYDLRHHYAIVNINSWVDAGFGFSDRLEYLSKSMGHRHIESTRYYYSIVPRLADTLMEKTEAGFNAIVPEVFDDEK